MFGLIIAYKLLRLPGIILMKDIMMPWRGGSPVLATPIDIFISRFTRKFVLFAIEKPANLCLAFIEVARSLRSF